MQLWPCILHGRMKPSPLQLVVVAAILAWSGSAHADDDDRERLVADGRDAAAVLMGWSVGSIAAGIPMWTSDDRFVRYAGIQNVAWGAVDGAIATLGLVAASRASREVHPEQHWKDARASLRRIFLLSTVLDIVYVAGGVALLGFGKTEPLRGTAAGILAQRTFLLTFDFGGTLLMRP